MATEKRNSGENIPTGRGWLDLFRGQVLKRLLYDLLLRKSPSQVKLLPILGD